MLVLLFVLSYFVIILATYEDARKKIVQAEMTSDLSSTEADDLPHKRTRKPQRFTSPGSDNEVEDSDDDNVLNDFRGQKRK